MIFKQDGVEVSTVVGGKGEGISIEVSGDAEKIYRATRGSGLSIVSDTCGMKQFASDSCFITVNSQGASGQLTFKYKDPASKIKILKFSFIDAGDSLEIKSGAVNGQLDLGALENNVSVKKIITLKNSGGTTLDLSMDLENSSISFLNNSCLGSLAPTKECKFTIEIDSTGLFAGGNAISVKSSGEELLNIPVLFEVSNEEPTDEFAAAPQKALDEECLANATTPQEAMKCNLSGSDTEDGVLTVKDLNCDETNTCTQNMEYQSKAFPIVLDFTLVYKDIIQRSCTLLDVKLRGFDILNASTASGQVLGTDLSSCLINSCLPGFVPSALGDSCLEDGAPIMACSLMNANEGGVILTSEVLAVAGDLPSCSVTECASLYDIAIDQKSCIAQTRSCELVDAQANGADITSALSAAGTVSAADVSACVISSCNSGFDVAIDQKSCVSQAVACTTQDVPYSTSVQGNTPSCIATSCISGFNVVSDTCQPDVSDTSLLIVHGGEMPVADQSGDLQNPQFLEFYSEFLSTWFDLNSGSSNDLNVTLQTRVGAGTWQNALASYSLDSLSPDGVRFNKGSGYVDGSRSFRVKFTHAASGININSPEVISSYFSRPARVLFEEAGKSLVEASTNLQPIEPLRYLKSNTDIELSLTNLIFPENYQDSPNKFNFTQSRLRLNKVGAGRVNAFTSNNTEPENASSPRESRFIYSTPVTPPSLLTHKFQVANPGSGLYVLDVVLDDESLFRSRYVRNYLFLGDSNPVSDWSISDTNFTFNGSYQSPEEGDVLSATKSLDLSSIVDPEGVESIIFYTDIEQMVFMEVFNPMDANPIAEDCRFDSPNLDDAQITIKNSSVNADDYFFTYEGVCHMNTSDLSEKEVIMVVTDFGGEKSWNYVKFTLDQQVCSSIANSDGTGDFYFSGCGCESGFIWNNEQKSCDLNITYTGSIEENRLYCSDSFAQDNAGAVLEFFGLNNLDVDKVSYYEEKNVLGLYSVGNTYLKFYRDGNYIFSGLNDDYPTNASYGIDCNNDGTKGDDSCLLNGNVNRVWMRGDSAFGSVATVVELKNGDLKVFGKATNHTQSTLDLYVPYSSSNRVRKVVSNPTSFAFLMDDNSVYSIGAYFVRGNSFGIDCDADGDPLEGNNRDDLCTVGTSVDIASTTHGFAVLLDNGEVKVWGNSTEFTKQSNSNVSSSLSNVKRFLVKERAVMGETSFGNSNLFMLLEYNDNTIYMFGKNSSQAGYNALLSNLNVSSSYKVKTFYGDSSLTNTFLMESGELRKFSGTWYGDCNNDSTIDESGGSSCFFVNVKDFIISNGMNVAHLNDGRLVALSRINGAYEEFGISSAAISIPGEVDSIYSNVNFLALDKEGNLYGDTIKNNYKLTSTLGYDCNSDGTRGDDECLYNPANKIKKILSMGTNIAELGSSDNNYFLMEDGSLYPVVANSFSINEQSGYEISNYREEGCYVQQCLPGFSVSLDQKSCE